MILDHFNPSPKVFRPASIEQYTILQIARRFNVGLPLKDYLLVAERHASSKLIKAYHRAARAEHPEKAFFKSLNH